MIIIYKSEASVNLIISILNCLAISVIAIPDISFWADKVQFISMPIFVCIHWVNL